MGHPWKSVRLHRTSTPDIMSAALGPTRECLSDLLEGCGAIASGASRVFLAEKSRGVYRAFGMRVHKKIYPNSNGSNPQDC